MPCQGVPEQCVPERSSLDHASLVLRYVLDRCVSIVSTGYVCACSKDVIMTVSSKGRIIQRVHDPMQRRTLHSVCVCVCGGGGQNNLEGPRENKQYGTIQEYKKAGRAIQKEYILARALQTLQKQG
jgi:hypothetical protein